MKKTLILAAACLVASLAQAAPPFTPDQLQLRVRVQPWHDLGTNPNSMYNPRFFDGNIFACQINWNCFARYPSGSSIISAGDLCGTNTPPRGPRMLSPMRGAFSSTYMVGSGGTANVFTRWNWDATNPQDVTFPDGQLTESFDWVDNDTIIVTDYTSGNRRRLYLVDVTAEPFALAKNTTWNLNGYATADASVIRIRNVRVGKGAGYSNYAYYGDNAVSLNPNVYALNLATGASTLLTNWNGTLKAGTGGGAESDSWGLWTVVACEGYLYLQSSDDGVQIYSMTGPTTMGELYTSYTPQDMQLATGAPRPALYGFDVAPHNEGLLLGSSSGGVYELGPPTLTAAKSGTDIILSWPASVTAVTVQSSSSLSPSSFGTIYPTIIVDGELNTATITPSSGSEFFRLTRNW